MKYKAVISGAGGLIGSSLLGYLKNDEDCESILVLKREEKIGEGKIQYLKFDFKDWQGLSSHLDSITRVFCCVGTTWKKTPKYEEYTRIDKGIPVNLARISAEKHVDKLLIISALGANPKSRNFYTKMKGEMEMEVLSFSDNETYILRPAQLLGSRNELRIMEGISQAIFKVINPLFFGPLKKYRAIKGSTVAKAMFRLSKTGAEKAIISNEQLFDLAK